MTASSSPDPNTALRHRIWPELLRVAAADSRLGHDLSAVHPDFRDSSQAIERIAKLPCYQSASTVFVTSDNALQELRYRALKDGKRVLVHTHALRRGFVLLDPRRISEERLEVASLLDGMEKRGVGRKVDVAQIQEEVGHIDLCITGALAVDMEGRRYGNGQGVFDIAFGMLFDRRVAVQATPVIAVVHDCQVIHEHPDSKDKAERKPWDVPCDFTATPSHTHGVVLHPKPDGGIIWEKLKPGLLESMPDLQELKGIQMMEKIMQGSIPQQAQKPPSGGPTDEELIGIRMMEQIMKGYKA